MTSTPTLSFFRAISISIPVLALAIACSSSDSGGTTTTGGAAEKTCANLAKCCDKLSEPAKTACSAAVSGKSEPACASVYDLSCGGGDGGTSDGGGTDGGSTSTLEICTALCKAVAKAGCESTPSETECTNGCLMQAAGKCADEAKAASACLSKVTYRCADGAPSPPADACTAENKAYSTCMGG